MYRRASALYYNNNNKDENVVKCRNVDKEIFVYMWDHSLVHTVDFLIQPNRRDPVSR